MFEWQGCCTFCVFKRHGFLRKVNYIHFEVFSERPSGSCAAGAAKRRDFLDCLRILLRKRNILTILGIVLIYFIRHSDEQLVPRSGDKFCVPMRYFGYENVKLKVLGDFGVVSIPVL